MGLDDALTSSCHPCVGGTESIYKHKIHDTCHGVCGLYLCVMSQGNSPLQRYTTWMWAITNMLDLHKKLVAEREAVLGEEKEAVYKRLGKIRWFACIGTVLWHNKYPILGLLSSTKSFHSQFVNRYRSSKSPQTLKAAVAKNVDKLKALARAEEEATRRLAEMEITEVCFLSDWKKEEFRNAHVWDRIQRKRTNYETEIN